ncbi:MAG: hypothetical protein QXL94_05175 [Candidatus Parvarchaeum sp.]
MRNMYSKTLDGMSVVVSCGISKTKLNNLISKYSNSKKFVASTDSSVRVPAPANSRDWAPNAKIQYYASSPQELNAFCNDLFAEKDKFGALLNSTCETVFVMKLNSTAKPIWDNWAARDRFLRVYKSKYVHAFTLRPIDKLYQYPIFLNISSINDSDDTVEIKLTRNIYNAQDAMKVAGLLAATSDEIYTHKNDEIVMYKTSHSIKISKNSAVKENIMKSFTKKKVEIVRGDEH